MNNFTKKGIVQKIIIVLIFLILFNFIYPQTPIVFAADSDDEEITGGVLLKPVIDFITAIGDGVIYIIQDQVLGMGTSLVHISKGEMSVFGAFVAGLAAVGTVAAGVAITIGTFGVGGVVAFGLVGGVGSAVIATVTNDNIPDDYDLPLYKISPQEIFANRIPALDINFINPSSKDSIASDLSAQISKWYVAIRNMVLVMLMVVLLYIGIRIVISSTASEAAKYKENIKDWLVAIIILTFMHYIMAFAININENIIDVIAKGGTETVVFPINGFDADDAETEDENLKKELEKAVKDGKLNYATNLMGYARLQQQFTAVDKDGNSLMTWSKIGYTVIFVVLVIYTVMFLIIYLKRVVYMAFLTMIAPLVALTYPIDKLKDGQAQAFGKWLKEYLFNLLLQPFHLLIYTMLIGSVMELAMKNMVYALVALGFLLPAEKLLRSFFGFEKSSVAGNIMQGAVGGAMAMSAISGLRKLVGGKGLSKGKGKGNSLEEGSDNGRIRTANQGNNTDDLLADGLGGAAAGAAGAAAAGGAEENEGNELEETGGTRGIGGTEGNGDEELSEEGQAWMDLIRNQEDDEPEQGGQLPEPEPIPIPPQPNRQSRARRMASSAGRSVLAAGKTAYRHKGKVIKGVARGALKLQGAAALGTIGLAGGLATGDLSNAFKYGAAGIAAGAAVGDKPIDIGKGLADKVKNGASGVKDTYMQERYTPEEYKEKLNASLDKKFLNDKDAIKLYKGKFGNDYEEAMQNALKYREYGITDDKAIIGAMKADLQNQDKTSKERIALAKVASTAKTEKELKDYEERLKDNGISEERIKEVKKQVRKIQDI